MPVRTKHCLHVVVRVILFSLICYMAIFRKKSVLTFRSHLEVKANIFFRVVVYFMSFNLIRNMTILLKKLNFNHVRGQVQSEYKMVYNTVRHRKMHRCIGTPNMGFLPQTT